MLTQMLPEQPSTAPVRTSRMSRAGRVGLAVSTSALLAGSSAAVVLLDHPTTPTVPTAGSGAVLAPGLASPAAPAVAPPITDLGPLAPTPAVAPVERRVENRSASEEAPRRSSESSETTESSESSLPRRSTSSADSTVSNDGSAAESRADRATERRAEAREQARERMRDRVERQVRTEVRDWMDEQGYGRWADAAGR